MDEPESAPDHKTLNALNEQIAAEPQGDTGLEAERWLAPNLGYDRGN